MRATVSVSVTKRLRRLRAAIVEFGEITAEEIAVQARSDRHDAPVIRGGETIDEELLS